MSGKIMAGGIVAIALIFGAVMYYLQVFYYYDEIDLPAEAIVLALPEGGAAAIPASDIAAIDASSSPIRFRACFATDATPEDLAGRFASYPEARPLIAPYWFDCFDAEEIGEALESGTAQAFLGIRDIHPGVDRVVAIFGDGRGYIWHQLNGTLED